MKMKANERQHTMAKKLHLVVYRCVVTFFRCCWCHLDIPLYRIQSLVVVLFFCLFVCIIWIVFDYLKAHEKIKKKSENSFYFLNVDDEQKKTISNCVHCVNVHVQSMSYFFSHFSRKFLSFECGALWIGTAYRVKNLIQFGIVEAMYQKK